MCGRITQSVKLETLIAKYGARNHPELDLTPHYNGAPRQGFVAVRNQGRDRVLEELRWGYIPEWAASKPGAKRLINARAETVHEKPSFRAAFRERRCVIPVNGWFEWHPESGQAAIFSSVLQRWRRTRRVVWLGTIVVPGASARFCSVGPVSRQQGAPPTKQATVARAMLALADDPLSQGCKEALRIRRCIPRTRGAVSDPLQRLRDLADCRRPRGGTPQGHVSLAGEDLPGGPLAGLHRALHAPRGARQMLSTEPNRTVRPDHRPGKAGDFSRPKAGPAPRGERVAAP